MYLLWSYCIAKKNSAIEVGYGIHHCEPLSFLNNDLTRTKFHGFGSLYVSSESEVWLDKNDSQKFCHTRMCVSKVPISNEISGCE